MLSACGLSFLEFISITQRNKHRVPCLVRL
jgi:hypothetical protein